MTTLGYAAARYVGDHRFEVARMPHRPPASGEVEIAPAFTGICGTDLHIAAGHMDARVTTPAVIGHETAGRVTAVGDGVTGWSVGRCGDGDAVALRRDLPGLPGRAPARL